MARKLFRQVDQFTPVAGDTGVRRRMPLGSTLSKYVVRLTGTSTVGVAVATNLEDTPYGFIKRCDVVLNGSFPLMGNVHGRSYFAWNRFMNGTPPQFTAPATAIGASSFVAEYEIPFAQRDLLPPIDSGFWLDTRLQSSVELVFDFGVAADVQTAGGGGTVALSALQITIFAEEIADVGGPTSRMQFQRQLVSLTATGVQDIPAGGLPTLGPAYRQILLHYVSGNTDPIRATSDDTILTDVSLIGDNIVRHVDSSPYRLVRSDNKNLYNIETMPAGWAVLDFARSRTLRDILLTNRTRSLILRQNIAAVPANTFVEIYPINPLLVVRARGR